MPTDSTLHQKINPATGEASEARPFLSEAELEACVSLAHAARQSWSRTSTVEDRAMLLRTIGKLHRERRHELARSVSEETGKPIAHARGEVDFTADIYTYYAEIAADLVRDEAIPLRTGSGSAILRRAPLGTILGIMPWNFPYYQVARFAAPNLAIGNPMILKHAPQCPDSAAQIERLFIDAGSRPGVYQNVYASVPQVAALIGDDRIQGVALTGSELAGAAVAEIAGRHLKKVVLELGGSDAFILLSTDDLDTAVSLAVRARLDNAGQACNSAKRFLVIDELYDEFVARFTTTFGRIVPGDPSLEATMLGPLSSIDAAERLRAQVDQAIASGARLAGGGDNAGVFFTPTVLTDVSASNPASQQEFFGPVAQIYRVGSEAEAIELANATPFGLGSYVFSTDATQARRVAEALDTGMVFINTVTGAGVELPFGGVKRSGIGRELGRLGADEFVNRQLIRTA